MSTISSLALNPFGAITVSFHTSPSPDVWSRIQADLNRQLPLRNLTWKSATRSVRTISQVPLNFQPLHPVNDQTVPPPQSSSHEISRPLLHMLFVACDDNEAYRTIVKQEIKTWIEFVQVLPMTEWLIIHVSAATKVNNNVGGIFRTKAGVLDKIKADFNPPKKDRCIQISYSGGNPSENHHDPTQWQDLITRLKDSLLAAFDVSVNEMEESVRSLDSKRGGPDWVFGVFFAEKAELANRFASMGLFEDSLLQYEELDAAFFQHFRDLPADWHGKAGATDPGDDSRSILRHDHKAYLELEEAISRATTFITTFAAFLRQHQTSLFQHFIESWMYSACMDLVNWCESQFTGKDLPTMQLNAILRLCAQLLELALNQLNKLGIHTGYLPRKHPFTMSIPSSISPPTSTSSPTQAPAGSITRHDLRTSLADKSLFEKLYTSLANRAIHMYQKSGRKRCALRLHLSLASYEECQGRSQSAQRLFAHLPAHYVDDKWTVIESSLLDRCATLQSHLGLWKEWLLSTLALVRSGVTHEIGGKWAQDVMIRDDDGGTGKMDSAGLARRLMKDIKDQASKFEKDFAAIGFPTFSIAIVGKTGRSADPKEGSIVSARVTNLLPCSVDVDTLRMKFSSARYDILWFHTEAQKLDPGETILDLFCPTPVAGTLVLELSQIRISRIIFQYPHRPASNLNAAGSSATGIQNTPIEVSFSRDPSALDVELSNPQDIVMSSNRICLFTLFSGRNRLAKADVSFSSEGRVNFLLEHCRALNQGLDLQSNENTLEFQNIEPNTEIVVSIPFSATTVESHASVLVNVDHYVDGTGKARRSFRKPCSLMISLPLLVNAQDFVRPDWIVSKFSVATDGINPIRIHSAHLDIPPPFSIVPARLVFSEATLVMVSQVANFLFKVIPPEPPHLQAPTMKLVLKYRLLIDEMLDILRHKLEELVDQLSPSQKPALPSLSQSLRTFLEDVGPQTAYLHYSIHRQFKLGEFDAVHWDRVCHDFDKGDVSRKNLVDIMRSLFESVIDFDFTGELTTPWQTLTIPVELPNVSVLNTTSLCPVSKNVDAKVGEPLAVDFVVDTSFRWCGSSKVLERLKLQPPKLIYELLPNLADWLVSGPTRGEFLAKDHEKTVIRLSLVPMRYGKICLPKLTISSSGTMDEMITIETHHLNRAESIMIYPSPNDSSRYFVHDFNFGTTPSPSPTQELIWGEG